jgi:hypothetical protein
MTRGCLHPSSVARDEVSLRQLRPGFTHGQRVASFTGVRRRLADGLSPAATRAWIIASEEQTPQQRGMPQRRVIMFAVLEFSRNAQRTICMLMSAVIVAASLSLGAYGAQSMLHDTATLTAVR